MSLEELSKELEKDEIVEEKPTKDVIKKVVEFANEVLEKYGDFIKGIVIFGSAARGKMKPTSDIDTWVIVDNTSLKSSQDVERIISELHLIASKKGRLHIQTTLLTNFWQWIKIGSPELINFLKYGFIIYDSGFVKPIKLMLEQGLLPPSEEAIRLKTKSSKLKLKKIDEDLKSLIFDLRYAATDICQAVIMHYFKAQPDQKEIPKYLKKLVEQGKIEENVIQEFMELNKLWKDVEHEVVKEVDGIYFDKALKLAKKIYEKMLNLLPEDIKGE